MEGIEVKALVKLSERHGDLEDTFIYKYEALGLTCLRFVEIFRDED